LTSIELQNKAFRERLAMNHQLLQKKYWFLPVDDVGHENFVPVGRGKKSSYICGLWTSVTVCKNVAGHSGISVKGMDCTNKVVAWHNHLWCHNPLCPVCFIRGWSVRGAKAITGRLEEGVRRGFGKIEHVTVSPKFADHDLPIEVLINMCRVALRDRGGVEVSGSSIIHGYRVDRDRNVLKWSPHLHCLAFLEGQGFDRCRDCSHVYGDCDACSGFKGCEVRGYKEDGILVKVHGERTTVFGTAFYLLNHATLKLGVKRFHVVTYFGKCGNRKYASGKSETKNVCPACGEEGVKCYHVGKKHLVKDIGDEDYVPLFVDDQFGENGEENYIEIVGGGHIE
jgi:hypothetical protein